MTPEQVEQLILTALHAVNEEMDEGSKVAVSPQTILFGPEAELDSLSLVSVIVDIETALNTDYNFEVSLTDDRAMTREISPFTDVPALKAYILELTGE